MVDYVHNYGGNSKISVMGIREVKTALNTSQKFGVLGNRKPLGQGREVMFAQLGAAAVGCGQMVQAPAIVANHQNRAVSVTASIGATEVFISLGATSASKDQYADGTLLITCGTGTARSYMIQGHPAWAASTSAAKVILKDGLELALDTTSITVLIANKAKGVVITPDCAATTTAAVQGVTLASAAASSFVYVGVQGEWPVKMIAGNVIGNEVCVGGTAITTGAVGPRTLTAGETTVGICRQTGSATGYGLVDFKL
jgi:hypothetical protein